MYKKILVVDDDVNIRDLLQQGLQRKGYWVETAQSGEECLAKVKTTQFQLIILDYLLPGIDGITVLKQLALEELPYVIMITGEGDIETAVRSMKAGASDFVPKPVSLNLIHELAASAFKQIEQQSRYEAIEKINNQTQEDSLNMVGQSNEIQVVRNRINIFSQANNPIILITGENGTGKELVAKALHARSSRKDKVFITLNCNTIPEHVFESELFGYDKGAFTDAVTAKKGFFELANGGTIFLDEFADLTLNLQAKLLRFMEERCFYRLGGSKKIEVDITIICATNKDLNEQVKTKTFREDLLYRINTFEIHLPPLRERMEDLDQLIPFFLARFNQKYNKQVKELNPESLYALKNYSFPGNIRELSNIIERAVLLSQSKQAHLDFNLPVQTKQEKKYILDLQPFTISKKETISRFELSYLDSLLTKTKGNLSAATTISGLCLPNISRLCSKYHLNKKDYTM